jgi:antitoxin (DNA-binding transcriptional repressor) of toxin-antitoxin stability system
MKDQDVELPSGSPILEQLVDAVASGTVTYLTRWGRRVAAIVPADLAASAHESLHRLGQLRRAQGVQPVMDPAELRGLGMPEKEFQAFFEAPRRGGSSRRPDHADLNALLARRPAVKAAAPTDCVNPHASQVSDHATSESRSTSVHQVIAAAQKPAASGKYQHDQINIEG